MKIIRRANSIFIVLFFAFLLVPMAKLNTKPDAVSEIDNRNLAKNPIEAFRSGGSFTSAVDAYISDRIGFRNNYIKAYEEAHDKVFGMLVHPSYMYGKNKQIYARSDTFYFEDDAYLDSFVNHVSEMQHYCNDNGMYFVFTLSPDKSTIRSGLLPKGLYYDPSWMDRMFEDLNANGVNTVDNRQLLQSLDAKGENVVNNKFDAAHYNDRGGYYCVNNVLQNIQTKFPNIHVNTKEEWNFGTKLEPLLSESEFVINEEVPMITHKEPIPIIDKTSEYEDSVYRDPLYPTFVYFENTQRKKEGAPRVLVFQGSHMNTYGYKFFENACGEYIYVKNYVNVLNYQYYCEKFKPDVVVFEVAQRTIGEYYFPIDKKEQYLQNIEAFEESRNGDN